MSPYRPRSGMCGDGNAMIERVDLAALIDLIDDERIRRALPGISEDARLRALARCIWLRDGDETAVFQPLWGGNFDAIILDIERDTPFVDAALGYLFADGGAKRLQLSSRDREAGHRVKARFLGPFMHEHLGFAWELARDQWLARNELH